MWLTSIGPQRQGKSPWRFRKGKGKGKSKGKGKGKGTKPLAERKEQLAELKKRTKCKDCGKVGHWAGDKECRGKDNKSAHLAVMVPPKPEEGEERRQRKKTTFCANYCCEDPNCTHEQGDNDITADQILDDLTTEESSTSDKDIRYEAFMASKASNGMETEEETPCLTTEWFDLTRTEPATKFSFGPYKGQAYDEVIREHPEYI